jgi:integrase
MHTVNDMLDRYERECMHALGERTSKDYRLHLKALREQFGALDVREVTPQMVRDYVQSRPKGKVQRTRQIAVLRVAFTEAQRKWNWVNGNPCAHIEKAAPRRRDPPLSMQEFDAALAYLVGKRRPALVMELALHTGQLQGDIIGLRWVQVHQQANTILFRDSHTKKKIEVRITPKIKELLARAKELGGTGEHVVTARSGERYTGEGFRAVWQRFQKKWVKTGNDKFTFHDIRQLSRRTVAAQSEAQTADPVDDYPQFDATLKAEAATNAPHYKVLYCFEQLIRQRVADAMERVAGAGWWDTDRVPAQIRQYAKDIHTKEVDGALTQRSLREIDYTTLGQLGQIIVSNWDGLFERQFTSKNAVLSVLSRLNMARGAIAHNCPISELEIERLGLTVRDWFNNALKKQQG